VKAGTGALKFMMDGETVVAFLCVLEEVFLQIFMMTAKSDDNTLSFFELISKSKIWSGNIVLTPPKSYNAT
jgi:hypothetical protein